jgi:hypothetical protein
MLLINQLVIVVDNSNMIKETILYNRVQSQSVISSYDGSKHNNSVDLAGA